MTDIRKVVREELLSIFQGALGSVGGKKSKKHKEVEEASEEEDNGKPKKHKERKAMDMQCRYESRTKGRCEERSKGPRFGFRCEKHIGK